VGEVTIRKGESGDCERAWAIVSEYYDAVGVIAREDRAAFEAAYFGEGSGFWLAGEGEDVVGCIALRPLDVFRSAGEVKRLYVKPRARGRGIAGRLLAALHVYAASCGYTTLYLDSKDDLTDAIRFYEMRGYRACERYNDNPQATVFMKLSLSG
jgi:GNAT superfamily N-acetyltransferase